MIRQGLAQGKRIRLIVHQSCFLKASCNSSTKSPACKFTVNQSAKIEDTFVNRRLLRCPFGFDSPIQWQSNLRVILFFVALKIIHNSFCSQLTHVCLRWPFTARSNTWRIYLILGGKYPINRLQALCFVHTTIIHPKKYFPSSFDCLWKF